MTEINTLWQYSNKVQITTCTATDKSLEGSEVQHCANLLIQKLEKDGVPELQFRTASLSSMK